MARRRFDDPELLDDIAGQVTGCPTRLMVKALKDATNAFLRATHIMRVDAWPIIGSSKMTDYEIDVDSDLLPISLVKLKIDGVTQSLPARAGLVASMLSLHGAPGDRSKIEPTVACALQRGVEEVEEWLLDEWGGPIKDKATAELLALPARNWTDAARAKQFSASYGAGVQRARNSMLLAGTDGNIRVRHVPF